MVRANRDGHAAAVLVLIAALATATCWKRDTDSTNHASALSAEPLDAGVRAGEALGDGAPPAAPMRNSDVAPPDCERFHRGLAGMVGRTIRAAGSAHYYDQAVARWRQAHVLCRSGQWYLAAARLLRANSAELRAGSIALGSPRQALAQGMTRAPSLELLTFVAFTTEFDGGVPLPSDACDRARAAPPVQGPAYETADRIAYVCGVAAQSSADYRRAADSFASIRLQDRFIDLDLRRAQTLTCAGRPASARAFARKARRLDRRRAELVGATRREFRQLRASASPHRLAATTLCRRDR